MINQGKKGFLGFGAKEAEVTVTIVNFEEPSVPEKVLVPEEAEPVMEIQPFEEEVVVESLNLL